MAKSAGKKMSNLFVWILMGLLFVALAGFGIGSFSGSASRLGAVGDVEITAEDYFRAVSNEISAQIAQTGQPVSFQQLRARGIDDQILSGLVARAALSHEAGEMGISVGDAEVARQISQNPAFAGPDGAFSPDSYQFVLQQQGLSVRDFESETREDIARALLQSAVIGATSPPELFVDALVAYQGETRDFTLLTIDETQLSAPLPEASDADLEAFYEEFGDRFIRPEARRISYAWLTPTMIMDEIEVNEDALRELYNDRLSIYVQPERRLLERLVFSDEAAAQAAFDAITAGDTDFDTLVEERDLTIDDVDLGEVRSEDLEPAAAEVIFADETSEILGPLPSSLGPALFRVNAVLEATETPFEEALPDLREELAEEAARRVISDLREEKEDLLASGATLEELSQSTDMELGALDFTAASEGGIAGYDAFREAALAVETGDFPEILSLSDGGVFALRLDEIVPAALPPLDEIRDEVEAAWTGRALRDALRAQAETLASGLAEAGALEDLGPTSVERLIRRQDLLPDLPPTLVAQGFQLTEPGELVVIPGAERAHILRLDRINAASRDAEDTSVLTLILEQTLAQSIAGDIFEFYGQSVQREAGISLNNAVLNSVNAQFP